MRNLKDISHTAFSLNSYGILEDKQSFNMIFMKDCKRSHQGI